jgi:hypothetical protein
MTQKKDPTNKRVIYFLVTTSIVFFIGLFWLILFYPDELPLEDTLTVTLENADKVMISDLEEQGTYKTTTNPRKIKELVQYLDHVTYTPARGHETGYVPSRAIIIYIFEQGEHNFIVPYENEAIIAYNVYRVNKGIIDNQFLAEYYDSLNE